MPRVLVYLSDRVLSGGAALEIRRALPTYQLSFRTADLWKGEVERADFIFAPSHPGIERVYESAGIPIVKSETSRPAPVRTQFPGSLDEVTIISAGPHWAETLTHWKPRGFVIAINRAVACGVADVWLALDGFEPFDRVENPPTQATITRYESTIYSEKYILVDDLWPNGVGGYTSTAAVTICKVLKVKKVYLVGHNCELDSASEARGWTPARLNGLDNEVRKAAKGLDITRIKRDGRKDNKWP